MILIYLTKLCFSMCRHMPRTPGIENGAPKHCVTQELKKKTENIHVFSHRFRANNVSCLSFYCCFTYCVSYRHLRIIDYVKCLSNESCWLCHNNMLKFSVDRLTTTGDHPKTMKCAQCWNTIYCFRMVTCNNHDFRYCHGMSPYVLEENSIYLMDRCSYLILNLKSIMW